MKKVQLLLACTLALAFCSCASTAGDIQIATAKDQQISLENYRTFSWFTDAALIADENNRFVEPGFNVGAELRYLIGREMRRLGYSEVVDAPADLLVSFIVILDMDAVKVVEERGKNITTLEQVAEGAIYVELIDPRTERAVWAGMATAEVQKGFSDDESKERLDYSISNMFKSISK